MIFPHKKRIVRIFHALLKIADVPVSIGVSLNALSVWKIIVPAAFVDYIIISEFALSRNTICMNISHKVRPIGIDKIIFLALTVTISEYTYQNGSIWEDGDSLAMRLMVLPLSMVAGIVDV